MKDSDGDSILDAYIDEELDRTEKRGLLIRMQNNADLRDRVCDLRRTRDWVRFSFEGAVAPTRSMPARKSRLFGSGLSVAATVFTAVIIFSAGWFGHTLQGPLLENRQMSPDHIVLHISHSDHDSFAAVLDRAEKILHRYKNRDVEIEVIANAGGLNLLRTSTSPYSERIRNMIARYDNIRFFACSHGMQKLREKGLDPVLIKGVYSDRPASQELIKRLDANWTYIKI